MAENVATENTATENNETEVVYANYIPNTKKNIILHGTLSADDIFNFGNGSSITIVSSAGNDTIKNFARQVSINGGEGDDIITSYSSGDYATIEGGSGNDYISAYANYTTLKYNLGEGDDTVVGLSLDDTIDLGRNSYTSSQIDEDIKISVGTGSILLKGGAEKNINIKTTDEKSERNFSNYTASKAIFGTNDADTIFNGASAESSTISTGAGDDSISNLASKVSLSGGEGNDKILSHSSAIFVTINGGTGDDFIDAKSSNKTIVYTAGDGNDTIRGVTTGDVIDLGQNAYSTVKSGNDIKIFVGEGSILLKNAVGQNFEIKDLSSSQAVETEVLADYAGGVLFFGKNDGTIFIDSAYSSDIANLYDVRLSDIVAANIEGNKISVTFNTGSSLKINSAENLSPIFNLADNASWQFNHSSGNWQSA